MVEKQVNDSPDFSFHLKGKPAMALMSALEDACNQALTYEQKFLPEHLMQPEPRAGENIVRFDHWKATHPRKRKTK